MIPFLITAFLVATVTWLAYWVIVRPVLINSVIDSARKLASDLDWKIIEGFQGSQSESALSLENTLKGYTALRFISLSHVIYYMAIKKQVTLVQVTKEKELLEKSPDWLKEMHQEHARLTVKALILNSPTWWPMLSFVFLICHCSKNLQNKIDAVETVATKIHCEVGEPA